MVKRLKIRFTIVVALLLTAVLMGIFATIYIMMYISLESKSVELLTMTADMDGFYQAFDDRVSFNLNDEPPADIVPPDDGTSRELPNKSFKRGDIFDRRRLNDAITVKFDESGAIFAIIADESVDTDLDALNQSGLRALTDGDIANAVGVTTFDGLPYRYLKAVRDYGGILVLLNRVSEVETLNRLAVFFIAAAGIGLFVMLGLGWLISDRAVKPIEASWEKQKRFIADASHELKTPLTIIAANLDVVEQDRSATVESVSKWTGYIRAETQRMRRLCDELLVLAKFDADEKRGRELNAEFSLSDALSEVCLPFEPVVYEAGRSFTFDIAPDIKMRGKVDELKQAAAILLDNALKNSLEGSEISFTLAREGRSRAVISCTDMGTFIPPELREKIFERFYRCDPSRAAATGGAGLGLAIAHDIAVKYGGGITADSEESGLTVFKMKIEVISL